MAVTQHKHIAASGCTAYHKASVPIRSGALQNAGDIEIVFYCDTQLWIFHPVAELPVKAVVFLVKRISELF